MVSAILDFSPTMIVFFQEADGPDKVPQCKSTCSIVLSACADLFPINAQNKYDPNTKINIDSAHLAHDEVRLLSNNIH